MEPLGIHGGRNFLNHFTRVQVTTNPRPLGAPLGGIGGPHQPPCNEYILGRVVSPVGMRGGPQGSAILRGKGRHGVLPLVLLLPSHPGLANILATGENQNTILHHQRRREIGHHILLGHGHLCRGKHPFACRPIECHHPLTIVEIALRGIDRQAQGHDLPGTLPHQTATLQVVHLEGA